MFNGTGKYVFLWEVKEVNKLNAPNCGFLITCVAWL